MIVVLRDDLSVFSLISIFNSVYCVIDKSLTRGRDGPEGQAPASVARVFLVDKMSNERKDAFRAILHQRRFTHGSEDGDITETSPTVLQDIEEDPHGLAALDHSTGQTERIQGRAILQWNEV